MRRHSYVYDLSPAALKTGTEQTVPNGYGKA